MRKFLMVFAIVSIIASVVLTPEQSYAQTCDTPITADASLLAFSQASALTLTRYILQESKFNFKATGTLRFMLTKRLDELKTNFLVWASDWADKKLAPSVKDMTEQLNSANIESNMNLGKQIDSQVWGEAISEKQQQKIDAQRRYIPSELSCQVDTTGPGQTKAYEAAKAVTTGMINDDMVRRGNTKGTPGSVGAGAEMNEMWKEYTDYLCDPDKGDPDCPERENASLIAGSQRDLAKILWGSKQTIDMNLADNRRMAKAAMNYLVYPHVSDPIPASAVKSGAAVNEFLSRRAEMTRTNAIIHTLGMMMSERMGGSGTDVSDMRKAAGIAADDTSKSASYREIAEAMNRDRYLSPKYILNMTGSPEQVIREQVSIGAARLQLMNDIYRRQEEMLLLSAAEYSRDLDKEIPNNAIGAASIQ